MINEENARPRIYEIGVLLVPTLGDEGAAEHYKKLVTAVTSRGGELINEGTPERIDLAYPMSQVRENKKSLFNEAYFAWYKFEIDGSLINEIEAEIKTDISILRNLSFKTVRENTYIPRRTPAGRTRRGERSSDEVLRDEIATTVDIDALPVVDMDTEDDVPVNESILDKKLDELTLDDIQ